MAQTKDTITVDASEVRSGNVTLWQCESCNEIPSKLVRDDNGVPYRECSCTKKLKTD